MSVDQELFIFNFSFPVPTKGDVLRTCCFCKLPLGGGTKFEV